MTLEQAIHQLIGDLRREAECCYDSANHINDSYIARNVMRARGDVREMIAARLENILEEHADAIHRS
jgi:hypothetical protein